MRYSTVLFDLDGTLLNTLDDIRDSLNHVLAAHGFPERSPAEVRRFVGNGSRRLLELSLPQGPETAGFEDLLAEYTAWYLEHSCVKTAPYEGVHDLLRQLAAREYKLAVVSNKPDDSTKRLAQRFFGDAVSVAIGERPGVARKPAPDTVRAALRELWSERWEAVYVGDSEVDIETARAAGLPCLSVTWGFRTEEELRAAGAKELVSSPRELLKFV